MEMARDVARTWKEYGKLIYTRLNTRRPKE